VSCVTAIAGVRRPTSADVAMSSRECMQGSLQSILELSARYVYTEIHTSRASLLSPHP